MGEPVKFVASVEANRVPGYHDPADETLPQRPIIGDNPLHSFDLYHTQVQADLGAWMTFSSEERFEKAKAFVHLADSAKMRLKIDFDRRCKILNYIIWMESHHKLGDSQVAAVAFNGLFPRHMAKAREKSEK